MMITRFKKTCPNPLAHAIMYMQRKTCTEAQVADGDYGCDEAFHGTFIFVNVRALLYALLQNF
ncbi:MAG: hypothetical protein ABI378_04440 [Chitinophagaceae bacterium]